MLTKLGGHKTCLVMAADGGVAGNGSRLDGPGVAFGGDWMLVVMKAIGLGTLRHRVGKRG